MSNCYSIKLGVDHRNRPPLPVVPSSSLSTVLGYHSTHSVKGDDPIRDSLNLRKSYIKFAFAAKQILAANWVDSRQAGLRLLAKFTSAVKINVTGCNFKQQQADKHASQTDDTRSY